jgi:beta-mannosidase
MGDLLNGAHWQCCSTPPGAAGTPRDLAELAPTWVDATLPGTAASALRAAGVRDWESVDYDAADWWFRAALDPGTPGRYALCFGAIATTSEVYFEDEQIASGTSMYQPLTATATVPTAGGTVSICCRALRPRLVARRARPPWRTRLVESQNLRFVRTSFFGRMPGVADLVAPVGPYRPVLVVPEETPRITDRHIHAFRRRAGGVVEIALCLAGVPPECEAATITVGSRSERINVSHAEGRTEIATTIYLDAVEPWWPHTHGPQPMYPLSLGVRGVTLDLGAVGFRDIGVDRSDDGFALLVNGEAVFCRGVCWVPVDPVGLAPDPASVRAAVAELRLAGCNMIRVPGTTVYEDDAFYDACDELGILVWQDCMLANLEPPDDDDFLAELEAEIQTFARRCAHRPAIAVFSGGSEIEQQAAMSGVARSVWRPRVLYDHLEKIVERELPGRVYVTSTPTGGDPPFATDIGVAHYFGVGAYRRPLDDARRASVRFAAECLAFAVPPEPRAVEDGFGSAAAAGHDPLWKRAVPRDAGASWDFEDVTAYYAELLLGVDLPRLRAREPERALDAMRAAVATCMTSTYSEWRRVGSRCAGGLVLAARDVRLGAGWGVVDARGGRKSAWYALRQVWAPRAILVTDEGLNGLVIHVVNEIDESFSGTVRVELFRSGEVPVGDGELPVALDARSSCALGGTAAFDHFVDLTYAYHFGPPNHDVVAVTLLDSAGAVVAETCFLPLGLGRPVEPDVGLSAWSRTDEHGVAWLTVTSRRFALFVVPEIPGFAPDDAWFHLAPGHTRTVRLTRGDGSVPPSGRVRAFNSEASAPVLEAR